MNNQSKIEKRRAYDREWKRQYKLKYPEKVKEKRRKRYYREKESPEWLEKHREYMRAYNKMWSKDNPERLEYRREWMKNWTKKNQKEIYKKRRNRPYEKLSSTIRTRLKGLIKHGYKSLSTEKLLGCSSKKLMEYLESKFENGMTWDNYGFYGWHVDHILPLSSFNLDNPEEQKRAFHYTNLQPLWAKDNLKKHAKKL